MIGFLEYRDDEGNITGVLTLHDDFTVETDGDVARNIVVRGHGRNLYPEDGEEWLVALASQLSRGSRTFVTPVIVDPDAPAERFAKADANEQAALDKAAAALDETDDDEYGGEA